MKILDKSIQIIQGGMGVGVSNWRLAKAVSKLGYLGVVSGTAIDSVIARRLQLGDADGSVRRALANFPWPDMAQRILDKYFIQGGKEAKKPFKLVSIPTFQMKKSCAELLIISNFIEVFLAKEGHNGFVGINYLEKIQLPTLASLFGAMLAGVNFVLMGGGIPFAIPGALDGLSRGDAVEIKLHVEENVAKQNYMLCFDPKDFSEGKLPQIDRPKFLAIISSDIVAKTLLKRATGQVEGFVVENYTAGGHNAPPRRSKAQSEPQYSEKDIPDIENLKTMGKPFWLAGGYASPEKFKEALSLGAQGLQIGTAFAYCNESAIMPELKKEVLRSYMEGKLKVITDFQASPTGYPFKLIDLENTITRMQRKRVCDLGYLRQAYCKSDSEVSYRCPGEPVESYIAKGGEGDKTIGKQCLCNGLLATIGLGQMREDGIEAPMLTAGEDFSFVNHLVKSPTDLEYSAKDVIDYLTKA